MDSLPSTQFVFTLANTTLFLGQQLGDAGGVRAAYDYQRGLLPFTQGVYSQARADLKAAARIVTPQMVQNFVDQYRPGLGPPPGSGMTSNSGNSAARLGGVALRGAGATMTGIALAYDGYQVFGSDNPAQASVQVGFGMYGSYVGGTLGVAGGTVIGGPPGGVVGGVTGSAAGAYLGRGFGSIFYNGVINPVDSNFFMYIP